MRLRTFLLIWIAIAATAPACSTPRQNLQPVEAASDASEGFSLVLNNRNYLDVNVFILHDGQASRVVTVTGSSSTAVVVPGWMMGKGGSIRIAAEPIGDLSSYTTDILVVQMGQIVELNLESSITRSNYTVQ